MEIEYLWRWILDRSAERQKLKVGGQVASSRLAPAMQSGISQSFPPTTKEGGSVPSRFNVGIDFGTSSTKVVIRDLIRRQSILYYPNSTAPGYPSFCLPSCIALTADGRILFGSEAELQKTGCRVLRSFKMCMACQHLATSCRGGCDPIAETRGLRGTFVVRTGLPWLSEVSAQNICTLFLAWLIKEVKNHISRTSGPSSDTKLTFNMCAPMDQFDHPAYTGFEKALFLGEKLSHSVTQGMSLRDGLAEALEVERRHPSLPSEDLRRTAVIPETLAAIVAYVNAPVADEGLYGIVDVGAGTTDISFFRLSFLGKERRPRAAFYHAQSTPVGADLVDHTLLRMISTNDASAFDQRAESSRPLQTVRLAKEILGREVEVTLSALDGCPVLTREQLNHAASPLGDRIGEARTQTWRRAFLKEMSLSRWRELHLFYTGGGARLAVIQNRLGARLHPTLPPVSVSKVYLGDAGRLLEASGRTVDLHDADLLIVAYGLSFPRVEFPDYFLPGSVDAFHPIPPKKRLPSPEDVGYEEK